MEDALRHHPNRREFYIIDQWGEQHNPHLRHVTEEAVDAIDAFLAEGREVVVHCHGGRSRTGFILKAWYMRTFGVKHAEAHTWLKANWPHYVTWNDDFEGFIKHEWMQERN
jgi:ADP-ribosyl-[dinitrogen reductase] hydrolase